MTETVSGTESATTVRYSSVAAGDELPAQTLPVRRVDLIRYCGASGDFNDIHWSDRVAREVGLPGVIAHGMFTMAEAARVVTDWCGDPGAVVRYSVRFSSMVVVPDDDKGATIEVTGVVTDKLEDSTVLVTLTARSAGSKVLTQAKAVVRLPA